MKVIYRKIINLFFFLISFCVWFCLRIFGLHYTYIYIYVLNVVCISKYVYVLICFGLRLSNYFNHKFTHLNICTPTVVRSTLYILAIKISNVSFHIMYGNMQKKIFEKIKINSHHQFIFNIFSANWLLQNQLLYILILHI